MLLAISHPPRRSQESLVKFHWLLAVVSYQLAVGIGSAVADGYWLQTVGILSYFVSISITAQR